MPFHSLANQFAGIVLLSEICLSLIGCIGSVIFTSIKAVKEGKKRQFPNLEKGLIISIGSLLFSLMFYGHENELKTLSNLKKSIEEYIK